jgi:hypothetical protein
VEWRCRASAPAASSAEDLGGRRRGQRRRWGAEDFLGIETREVSSVGGRIAAARGTRGILGSGSSWIRRNRRELMENCHWFLTIVTL